MVRTAHDLLHRAGLRLDPKLMVLDHARFDPAVERAGWQAPQDVSLAVHEGKVVGLPGLMGAGRTELLSALYGFEVRERRQPSAMSGIGVERTPILLAIRDRPILVEPRLDLPRKSGERL